MVLNKMKNFKIKNSQEVSDTYNSTNEDTNSSTRFKKNKSNHPYLKSQLVSKKLDLKFENIPYNKMIGTLYNNIKSVSNWTKEYISSGEFKRVVFSVVTVGGYHYYFIDKQNDFREKQYILQKENLDAKIKHDEEMRRKEEEIRKRDMELEHIRLINEIKELNNKWWFQK